MSKKPAEYGIILNNTLTTDLSKAQHATQRERTVLLGQILKIEGILAAGNYAVRFLKQDGESWESVQFCVEGCKVMHVGDKLWQFLLAVTSPQERVRIAQVPNHCEKLLQINIESTVELLIEGNNMLGVVKYIGQVKGMGPGHYYGISLHERKPNTNCNGMCAGIQYFVCLPGYGIFASIDTLVIAPTPTTTKQPNTIKAVKTTNSSFPADVSTNFRASSSLQNISNLATNEVLHADRTYPDNGMGFGRNDKYSSEIDLIEAIGGSWPGITDRNVVESYAELKLKNNGSDKVVNTKSDTMHSSKYNRNRSANVMSHLVNGPSRTGKKIKDVIASKPDRSEEDATRILNEHFTTVVNMTKDVEKEMKKPQYEPPDGGTINDLGIGSLVEVSQDVSDEPLYGVIRWLGEEKITRHILVGVELEEENSHLPLTLTNGTHNGQRYFDCAQNRGLFVPLEQCNKDSRFQDGVVHHSNVAVAKLPGQPDCPIIQGAVPPLCMPTEEDVEAVCGKFRGIQGHHNSCYLDATLFAMFTYTAVFDSLLYRPKGPNDIAHYEEVQRVLREEIVNPLRSHLYVSADRVMNLRKLLDELSSVSGLTSEEKDPEEFLNSLLAQILKAEPFLKLSSGQEAYHYQLFVEKDEDLELPSVQQLFEQSFLSSDIKLKEVPSCLIIQMPRFGKSYKMYPRILPSQLLDVTDIIENSPRQCTVCGKLAHYECRECLGECGDGLESTAFCRMCLETAHTHARRSHHRPHALSVSTDFTVMAEACGLPPPRLYMELFAVVCIETSHYVAFVKCGSGHEAPWCFFDSMADRKGEQNGFNIPEMVACPDVSCWLSHEQMCRQLHENAAADRQLPEHARRLLCDAYICMYQSPDVMMYR